MARKHRRFDASDDDSQDSDYEVAPRKKKAKAAVKKAQKPKVKAEIIIRATDTPTDEAAARDRLSKVDTAVLERIKKALALGNHVGTSEEEARAALRNATKLLEKHNINQADLLSQETEREKLKRAGTSVVSIRSTSETPSSVNVERWGRILAHAMTVFFDCQYYTTAIDPRIDWSFYGLAEQTVTAALAFEMTYNLILAWSLNPSVGTGVHEKNCYRIGVADGLTTMAKNEKEEEKKRASHREKALIQSRRDAEKADELTRIARLTGPAKAEADMEVEVKEKLGSTPKDIRVRVEEVEDEDVKRSVDRNTSEQGPTLLEDSLHMGTLDRDAIPDGLGNWSALQLSGDSPDEMSDDDGTEDVGSLDQSDFLPADFHDNDDADIDLASFSPAPMGPPSSTVPIAEQKATMAEDDDSQWNSVGQLVTFRESSVAIGDNFLKSQGIKLSVARRSRFAIKNEAGKQLYRKGQQDAKRINVRRRLLKGAEDC